MASREFLLDQLRGMNLEIWFIDHIIKGTLRNNSHIDIMRRRAYAGGYRSIRDYLVGSFSKLVLNNNVSRKLLADSIVMPYKEGAKWIRVLK